MANVNPSPIRPPKKWLNDPEISKDVQDLYFFMYQLLQRTGGGTDFIEDNAEGVADNADNITIIFEDLENLEDSSNGWPDTQYSIIDFQGSFLESVQSRDYVTIGNEIIKLVNNTTVKLNLKPSDSERVYVKSTGKGFRVQSSKLIDGKDCIRFNKPFSGYWFSYSLELDTWSIL